MSIDSLSLHVLWGCQRNMNRSHGMLNVFKMLQSAFQMIFGTQIILTWKYSYIGYFKLLIKNIILI